MDDDYESDEEVDELVEDKESDSGANCPLREDSADSLKALEDELFGLTLEEMDEVRDHSDADIILDHPDGGADDITDLVCTNFPHLPVANECNRGK